MAEPSDNPFGRVPDEVAQRNPAEVVSRTVGNPPIEMQAAPEPPTIAGRLKTVVNTLLQRQPSPPETGK